MEKLKTIFNEYYYLILGVPLALLIIDVDNTSTPRITDSNARDLCASYIGEEFGRSASIISTEIIKRDSGVFVHAWYNRPMDNSRWDYVCNLYSNTIVWAAIDSGKVGRWRFEDEAKIYYSSDSDRYNIRY
ncbi:MAG: hypothetical protein Kow0083_05940 [Methylophaga sp.]